MGKVPKGQQPDQRIENSLFKLIQKTTIITDITMVFSKPVRILKEGKEK